MPNADQLFLLRDHIKLSLLERKRAKDLGLDDVAKDDYISRSLEQLRDGIITLEQTSVRLQLPENQGKSDAMDESLAILKQQLDSLMAQFHGFSNTISTQDLSHQRTMQNPVIETSSSATTTASLTTARKPKTVRFSDSPSSPTQELFARYLDDPAISSDSPNYTDGVGNMTNQQLHQSHSVILQEQDEHLDRLGESIGRQRELSMQIGDELESHAAMLDEVDHVVDRHQSRLSGAKRILGRVTKSAAENKQMTAIFILIIVLILLIAILK